MVSGCGSKPKSTQENKVDTKKQEVKKETNLAKIGSFKLGYFGETQLRDPFKKYVDIRDNSSVGSEYQNYPKDLDLFTYSKFIKTSGDIKGDWKDTLSSIKKGNLDTLVLGTNDEYIYGGDRISEVSKLDIDSIVYLWGKKGKELANGSNITSFNYDKYISSYLSGYQALVNAISFEKEDGVDTYEKTIISVFVGSYNGSTNKKLAKAFLQGVLEASTHSLYSPYVDLKVVKEKDADNEKTNNKLHKDLNDWVSTDKKDASLSKYLKSDTFSDGDKKIIYLAGSSVKDWNSTIYKSLKWDTKKENVNLVLDTLDSTNATNEALDNKINIFGSMGSEIASKVDSLHYYLQGIYNGGSSWFRGKSVKSGAFLVPYDNSLADNSFVKDLPNVVWEKEIKLEL